MRLRVDRAWKWPGDDQRPPRELVVVTAQGPACGAYFSREEEWLVFAYPDEHKGTLWTGQCTGTDQVNRPGTELWERRLRERVRERLQWLTERIGEGSRPVA